MVQDILLIMMQMMMVSDLGSGMSPEEIEGCQDVSACNYMETATDPADCILATGCESC